jgi:hypothetical protein
VSAGAFHTLALQRDTSLWAWGANRVGRLGDGTTTASNLPRQIGRGFAAVSAGSEHSVALKSDGSLWTWGDNSYGQLGDGGTERSLVPQQVGTGYTAIAASAGLFNAHTLALKADGSLWLWGRNVFGQLGDESNEERHSPQLLGTGYVGVAAGWYHSVAIRVDGTAWSWGYNNAGQLGDGTFAARRSPVAVVNDTADGPLDLIPASANSIAADKIPAFFVLASGSLASSSTTLRTQTRFQPGDLGRVGAVYVTAMVPSDAVAALLGLGTGEPAAAPLRPVPRAADIPAGYVPMQLTDGGWQRVVAGQLLPYATGVLGESMAAQTLLDQVNTSALGGAEFCVGYGDSAQEMDAAARIRAVATLALDLGATRPPAPSCTLAGVVQGADCLFDWAGQTYAPHFAPVGLSSRGVGHVYYRYFSQTQSYLAVTTGRLMYLGPLTAQTPYDLGPVSGWLQTAGCR